MSHLHKAFCCAFLLPTVGFAATADLRVTVEGASNRAAPVYFSLYDDPRAFGRMEEGIRMAIIKSWQEHPSVAFTDLSPGPYVVAVFQDLNGNGRLDTNLVGRPIEPYALSGKQSDKAPRFDHAAIHIDSDDEVIRLRLRH